jgi:hypothetical protein
MFEKSIHAMDNVGSMENSNEDNPVKTHSNEGNPASRNGRTKKLNGNASSKEQSCTVS